MAKDVVAKDVVAKDAWLPTFIEGAYPVRLSASSSISFKFYQLQVLYSFKVLPTT